MGTMLCIYENVASVMHARKDQQQRLRDPAVNVIAQDMSAQGYTWQCRQLDSQDFLVPHRRTRAWGTASKADVADDTWLLNLDNTFADLRSSVHFPNIFLPSLPKEQLPSKTKPRVQELLSKYKLERADYKNLFVDTCTSSGRSQEHAVGVTTCVRPSDNIWNEKLQRHLTGAEFLMVQGVFAQDFSKPEAVRNLHSRKSLARSMAGLAFSTTVLQANLLAMLVHSGCWTLIRQRWTDIPRSPNKPVQQHDSEAVLLTPPSTIESPVTYRVVT